MRFTRYNQRAPTTETNELAITLARWHLSQSSSPQGERLLHLLGEKDFLSVVNFAVDYTALSAHQALHLRQALAFFQKRVDLDLGIDREAVAFKKFVEAEQLCQETNDIFRLRAQGKFHFSSDVESVLYVAQRKIARILGDVPRLDELKLKFGPGATTQVKKKDASSREKLGSAFACSEDLSGYVSYLLEQMPAWWVREDTPDTALVSIEIHRSKLCFVPKSAKTDRGIAVEPSLNTMFQLGIGRYMSSRLRRFGVDISDQTLNQRLALEGSLTGELATLDLSSASDTISKELVYNLLPVDWSVYLNRARTCEVEYQGQVIRLQKFSSMGNGFTFPLETLIFFALASASCEVSGSVGPVNAYGDDLIVPTGAVDLLTRVLRASGFLVNADKSFSSGPFRESCGKDYYSGIDIRPVYLKDRISAADVFVLHNHYVRTLQDEPASILLSLLEEPLRKWGPDGYGDGHLLGDWPRIPHGRERGWGGYIFETFTLKARKSFIPSPGDFVFPSYCVYVNEARSGLPGFPESSITRLNRLHGRATASHDVGAQSTLYSKGRMGTVVPGSEGYKLIKIYTLMG